MSIPTRVRRRDRLFIIAEILDTALEPVLKTQIMYRACLSFAQLNEYLSLLVNLEFLEVIKDEKNNLTAYKTASAGLHYLTVYNEIRELLRKKPISKSSVLIQERKSKQK